MTESYPDMIPVIFICDDRYAMPAGVAIVSLLRSKKPMTRYEIFVLGIDISSKSKDKLESLATDGLSVKVIEHGNKFAGITAHTSVSASALFKFEIADIITGHDKLIYLDSDVIVLDDLSELYGIDLGDRYAGVVRDLICEQDKDHEKLGLRSYFNSGVMLLNSKKIRDEHISKKLIDTKKTLAGRMFMDQDAFNVVFGSNILLLSCKYNFHACFKRHKHDATVAAFFGLTNKEAADIRKHPAVLHFTGRKPWVSLFIPASGLWNKTYKESPYGDPGFRHLKRMSRLVVYGIKEKIDSIDILRKTLRPPYKMVKDLMNQSHAE